MSGLYVFGLSGQKAATFVAAGHRIEFVKADDVYAAVERVSRPPAVSEETLRKQHEVVAHIAGRVEALLPARFGAFVDARELRAVVAGRRHAILEALARDDRHRVPGEPEGNRGVAADAGCARCCR
jgi:hypothetical protein